jgi:hypothetical protein
MAPDADIGNVNAPMQTAHVKTREALISLSSPPRKINAGADPVGTRSATVQLNNSEETV